MNNVEKIMAEIEKNPGWRQGFQNANDTHEIAAHFIKIGESLNLKLSAEDVTACVEYMKSFKEINLEDVSGGSWDICFNSNATSSTGG